MVIKVLKKTLGIKTHKYKVDLDGVILNIFIDASNPTLMQIKLDDELQKDILFLLDK